MQLWLQARITNKFSHRQDRNGSSWKGEWTLNFSLNARSSRILPSVELGYSLTAPSLAYRFYDGGRAPLFEPEQLRKSDHFPHGELVQWWPDQDALRVSLLALDLEAHLAEALAFCRDFRVARSGLYGAAFYNALNKRIGKYSQRMEL